MNSDQLALRHKVNLIYIVFKIRFYWGRSCEICCGILLQFIFAYVKILLQSILFSEKYCYNLYFLV